MKMVLVRASERTDVGFGLKCLVAVRSAVGSGCGVSLEIYMF